MQYLVPQFIERELKVVGPLSFRQFIFVGFGLVICTGLYFWLAPKSFFLFLVACGLVMTACIGLAFGQVEGRSMAGLLGSFIAYNLKSRSYFWKKRAIASEIFTVPKLVEKSEAVVQPKEQGSSLENLAVRLERGTK